MLPLALAAWGGFACGVELPGNEQGAKGPEGEVEHIIDTAPPVKITTLGDAVKWLDRIPGPISLTESFKKEDADEALKFSLREEALSIIGLGLSVAAHLDEKNIFPTPDVKEGGTTTPSDGCGTDGKAVSLGPSCQAFYQKICACPGLTKVMADSCKSILAGGSVCELDLTLADEAMCADILGPTGFDVCQLLGASSTPATTAGTTPTTRKAWRFPYRAETSSSGPGSGGSPATGATPSKSAACPQVTNRSDAATGLVDIAITGGCTNPRGPIGETAYAGTITLTGKLTDTEANLQIAVAEPFTLQSKSLTLAVRGSAHAQGVADPAAQTGRLSTEGDLWVDVAGTDPMPLLVGSPQIAWKTGETEANGSLSFSQWLVDSSGRGRIGPPGWRTTTFGAAYDHMTVRVDPAGVFTLDGTLRLSQTAQGGKLLQAKDEDEVPPEGSIQVVMKKVTRSTDCALEPLSGKVELKGDKTATVTFNGGEDCDGRALIALADIASAEVCVIGGHCPATLSEAIAELEIAPTLAKKPTAATTGATEKDLLAALAQATPEELAIDANGNGTTEGEDLLRLLRTRIAFAPNERPVPGQTQTITEAALERLAALDPARLDDVRFLLVVYNLAQTLKPITDFLGAMTGLSSGGLPGANTFVSPVISIVSPDTPCIEGGLAQCGKDLAGTVAALGNSIAKPGGYRLGPTPIVLGSFTFELGGLYNEAAFRTLGALGEGLHSAIYFLAAHVDITSLLSEATYLMDSGLNFDFETAGQVLTTIDQVDGLILKLLGGPLSIAGGADRLRTARDSAVQASKWVLGGGTAKPALVTALEAGREKDAIVRFDDGGDGLLNGCDTITLNILPPAYSALASLLLLQTAAEGCPTAPQGLTLQLPRTQNGRAIDYTGLFPRQAAVLSKLPTVLTDKSSGLTSREVTTLLFDTFADTFGDAFQIFPAVLFESGLSALTPASTGSGSTTRLVLEAEVNADAPKCPYGRPTAPGYTSAYVCRDKQGVKDWSASLTFGDSDHFSAQLAKDGLFVNEALLNAAGAPADHLFRAARGGGFLLYLRMKDPALKGLFKASDRLITELTNTSTGVCSRTIGAAPATGYVSTDDRVINAFVNWVEIQAEVCGATGQMSSYASSLLARASQ